MIRRLISVLLLTSASVSLHAYEPIEYHASVTVQGSTSSPAPYMLGSWNGGRYVTGNGIWQEGGLFKPLDLTKRFSWSAGIDYIVGASSSLHFDRWDKTTDSWTIHSARYGAARLTQLFANIKYRSVFLTAGMKHNGSRIVDANLSSGDLVRSNNAAAIPGVSAGFIDFQKIPFTKGFLEIEGQIMYGRMTDSGFKKSEFNYYSNILPLNIWYTYKRVYFRSTTSKPLYITLGMQAAGMFGGSTYTYKKGILTGSVDRGFRFKDILRMFFPTEGGESYYTGSHLGSWDLKADYSLHNGSHISAYFQWPWEDGSGIGRKNGWDGLWGLQYDFPLQSPVSKILIEYLDFTNQSGPVHYAEIDHPNSPMTGHADGGDDYYNNGTYGAYTNYGIGIGTPFLKAPVYYREGVLEYLNNRARGFHAAVMGHPTSRITYRAMVSYQIAGGNGRIPAPRRLHATSALLEATALPLRKLPALELTLTMAYDHGSLWGDNFGARIKIAYRGEFKFKSRNK